MAIFKGNRVQVAKALGICISTLKNWIRDREELRHFHRQMELPLA